MPNKALKSGFFATFSGQNAKVRGKALKSGFFATFSGQNAKVRGKSLKSDFSVIPPDKTHIATAVLIDPNSSNQL